MTDSVPEFALGDAFTLSGVCKGASGPADLTGATVQCGIAKYRVLGHVLHEEATIVGDPEDGAVSFKVTSEQCIELDVGDFEYEFEAIRDGDPATFPGGSKPRFRIVPGIVPTTLP